MSLKLDRLGWEFINPVLLASGPAGFGLELATFFRKRSLGGLTTKTLTREPRQGNPPPRLVDAPAGALNSIGLANPGLEIFFAEILPQLRELPTVRVVSFAAPEPGEAEAMAGALGGAAGVDVLELNLSCPNVDGRIPAWDSKATGEMVRASAGATHTPLLAKLSPDVPDVVPQGEAALKAGATGLTLVNAVRGLRIKHDTGLPAFARKWGGLSGGAILPISLAKVFQARQAFPGVPIVGVGGVTNLGSLLEMAMAGADLVGLGLAVMADPALPWRLVEELEEWLSCRGIGQYSEVVGCAHRGGLDVPKPA
ncbi:MAG: dihydroorotate dehydrogenase [Candidatus Bipolaricaulota bacterium]